jgi:hypothetical protein
MKDYRRKGPPEFLRVVRPQPRRGVLPCLAHQRHGGFLKKKGEKEGD